MLRLLRTLSVPQIKANRGRTALVVGGIAIGVALIAAINIINESVLENFRQTIEVIAGPADLQVTLGVGEVGFSEAEVETVRANADVAVAVPLVRGTVALADDPTEVLQLFGADLVAEQDLQRYRVKLATKRRDAAEALVNPKSIFLTGAFARKHRLAVGDALRLSTPSGIQQLTVRGLLEAQGLALAFGGQLAVMDIVAAQDILGKQERIDQIDIVLRDRATAARVERSLETALPDVLEVQAPAYHGMQIERVLSSFQAMLTGLSSLCLIAGLFIIYNTTSTAAIQRTPAIAILRLLGANRRRLLGWLTVEALGLGILGAAVGVALGVPLAWILSGTITSSMGVIFQLRFPLGRLAIDPLQLTLIAAAGVVVAVFASSFAARRMAMLDPLQMMRQGADVVEDGRASYRLIIAWGLLVATSAACFLMEDRQKSIAWGNFGSTLWNASVVVIAIPVVARLAGPLSWLLPKWFGAEGQVAAGSLGRARVRSGVTVAAIALILTVATLLSSLVLSCRESLASYFAGFLASDLTVSAVSTEGGWLETPSSGQLAPLLAQIPGVDRVDTARVLPGQGYKGERIAILALSPALFDPDRAPSGWYREGDPQQAAPSLQAGRAVNVSTSLSDRFDLHAGGSIELDSPTGKVRLPIMGVVPDYVSDRGSVIMSRQTLAEHWQETNVNRFLVSVDDGAKIDMVRDRIKMRLGRHYRLKILSAGELLKYHTAQINRAFAVMNSVQLLIIIVTVTGIFDLLLSRIMERRRELALWQLIGASRRSVRRSVVVESVTLGIIGALLGVAVGMVTAWVWVAIHFRQLLGYYVEYHFATGAMLWYLLLVIVMTIGAGSAAARRATKEPILNGIRNE